MTQPKENESTSNSLNEDHGSNTLTPKSRYQDHESNNRTHSGVASDQSQVDKVSDASITQGPHAFGTGFDQRDRTMIKRFESQTEHLRKDEVRFMRNAFMSTLHYRYAVIDSNDHEKKLNECIKDATEFMMYKDQRFHHTSSVQGYVTDAAKRKCTFFLKVLAKNIAFDVGYWDIVRNGKATPNVGGLCYCPCSRWFNTWTETMCPSVPRDTPTWPCNADAYMTPHEFEQHLFDVMKDDACDLYHSLIVLYLIKFYPLANTLLEFNEIKDFFVNYSFCIKSNVQFYGFKNITINHDARILDDDISSIGTLDLRSFKSSNDKHCLKPFAKKHDPMLTLHKLKKNPKYVTSKQKKR